MKNIFKLLAFLPLLTACDDLFEPALENNRDLEAMYKEPSYAQGILANAYIILPYETSPTSDLATDDAVTNEISSNYLRMATGSWTANNNPVSQWQNRFTAYVLFVTCTWWQDCGRHIDGSTYYFEIGRTGCGF